MSEQENVMIVRKIFDHFNNHMPDELAQYLSNDVKVELPLPTGYASVDKQKLVKLNQDFWNAFPDLHFDLKDIIAEGDKVAATYIVRGTHRNPLRTPTGDIIPPTQKTIQIPGSIYVEFRNNMIGRLLEYWDQLTLLNQLGVVTEQDVLSRARR